MKPDIKTLLDRGTVDVIVREELEKKLQSGKKLRIKFGIDPTGADLHLGHAVPLRKLKQFQDAGHTAILLIGDYTAKIGDPTGRSETRVMLTDEQIKENMKDYINQASIVLDINKLEVRHNSEWFGKMNMGDILNLTAKKTVQQILQREDFKKRMRSDQDIATTEMLYPLMQGYDSVMLGCDVELGATDQLFNMMVGRDLQRREKQKVIQDVVTVPILEGTDGVEKISKSFNNYIGLTESPEEMYGKTMSLSDNMILRYFELATEVPLEEIEKLEQSLKQGENPKNLKMKLAREIVTIYHDKNSALQAEKEFQKVHANKEIPDDIQTKKLPGKKHNVIKLIITTGLAPSTSEVRRLIIGGGVKIDGKKIDSIDKDVDITKVRLIQVGKRKFIRVIVK